MAMPEPVDTGLVKALGHPLRAQILDALIRLGESSPLKLSRELDRPLRSVSHHIRVLRDLDCVELVRTEPRRGAVEHFYRAAVRSFLDDEQWARLPITLRRELASQTLRQIFEDAASAGAAGGFDQPGAQIARMPLELDPEGWEELAELLATVVERAQQIQERSDVRGDGVAEGPPDCEASELAILHFAVKVVGAARVGRRAPLRPTSPAPERRAPRGRSPGLA